MLKRFSLAVTTAIFVGSMRASATPIAIANSSFETPAIATYAYNPSGAGWTFSGASGIQHNGSAWGAPNSPDGVQTAFLQNSNGNGSFAQGLSLTAGTYTISFQSALRKYQSAAVAMSFNVKLDDAIIGSFAPQSTNFASFTSRAINLNSGQHVLAFVGTAPAGDTSVFIDQVTLNRADSSAGTLPLKGVNLSGAEYNLGNQNICANVNDRINNVTKCIYNGWDYVYPTTAELDYYSAKGLKLIRVPFDGNRLQLQRNQPLNGSELALLDNVVTYANSKGLTVLLDPHNFGYLNDASGTGRLIGVDPLMPASMFADLWSRIATHYLKNSQVIFGLMNEPNAQSAAQWKAAAVAAVAAIRATGATQKIFVPGTSWTGAHSWTGSGNAAAWAGFTDPNFAFEVHQYLDSDSSGTHAACVPGLGATVLNDFTQWARTNHVQGFVGEIGWANNAGCTTEANAFLASMAASADVYLGYSYWAGGAWLGTYMYSIEPSGLGTSNVGDQPQMAVLLSH